MQSKSLLFVTCLFFTLQNVAKSEEDDDHRVKAAEELIAKATVLKLESQLLLEKALEFQNETKEEKNHPSGVKHRQEWDKTERGLAEKLNSVVSDVCVTDECFRTASRLLKFMDTNVEPCDDFYQFACGRFLESTKIPDDKTSVDTFSVIYDELLKQVQSTVEEQRASNEPRFFSLAKDLYQTCMDTNTIQKQQLDPLRSILKELGGWPVLEDDWNEANFDFKDLVHKLRRTGYSINYLFTLGVDVDLKNSTRHVIYLDEASLGLSREFLTDSSKKKFVDRYFKYMVEVAVLLGANKTRARDELRESLEFEMQLANISLPTEKRRNATKMYNPTTIRELQEEYPLIPWKEYINNLLQVTHVDDDEVVIVHVPEYLTAMTSVILNTSKRDLANYMVWRVIADSVMYLDFRTRATHSNYMIDITGTLQSEPRWKECVKLVSNRLSVSVGALYVRKYVEACVKNEAEAMTQDIQGTFINILTSVDWMDKGTKKSAVEKAMNLSSYIAYPDELLGDKEIDEFYAKLQIDGDVYLRKVLNLTKFELDYAFGELRKPVRTNEWIGHADPAAVDAFYSVRDNSIHFPAGILQGALFHKDRPRYMNYGAIGSIIGHEITHGFDDQGRQFDKDGNLVDWWSPDSEKKYLEKAQCIIDQYGNYTAAEVGLQLNGINTQAENIADNGGVRAAYIAYNDWVARDGAESRLPGLKYTPNQMFWISAANTWCTKYRPEMLTTSITTGSHSPGEFRVLGPLSNLPEFAKDFNCPIGSKMNPEKKCSVW